MFFDEYPKDKLTQMWREFAKVKKDYTPQERWDEVIDKNYRNAEFAVLTLDNIIYDFYRNTYDEEAEKTCVPCVCTSVMVILGKKTNIDYGVELVLPAYEFTTYLETTRLSALFERTREVSELKDDFKKYEGKLMELFPVEDVTLWNLLNDEEMATKFDELCDNNDGYGIAFIDVFTNILVYDFVKNYMQLTNERNLNDLYKEDEEYYGDCVEAEDGVCYDTCETENEASGLGGSYFDDECECPSCD